MKKRKFSKNKIAGFTLIEALLIVVLVGILTAIAAPSWVAFLNNQRVNTARNEVFEILRSAQAEAKRTKVNRAVCLDDNTGKPRVAVRPSLSADTDACTPSTINNWTILGNGNLKPGTIQLLTTPVTNKIVFDTYGNLDPASFPAGGYKIIVKVASAPNTQRCVNITTLLGAMSQGSGSQECN